MIGTKLAHYEITSHLGSGGMGEVYQATDSKLGRSVAIKLLPEVFSHDSERIARFEREARALAALNHSNIAAIFGLEESGDRKFLVMELVDGETLADRIKRGPIPVDESLTIAKQICEALEAAHERGIIHRDLKPANVKITPDRKAKVLDFGLAKAFENEPASAALSNSPTLSMAATNAGMILGTAAYMSPEQAKGRQVDRRTDIFSFGALLYEMLTGCAAFEGEDVQDILGAVLKSEPDWSRLPAVPSRIRELLRLCLQKDAKQRRQSAGDVRIDIEQALAEPAAATSTRVAARSSRLAWALAGIFGVGLIAAVVASAPWRSPPLPSETRTDVVTPATNDVSFALSPDGRQIVFVAFGDGQTQLWVRPLDGVKAQPLVGTEGASRPFWSPDNRSVGFFAGGKLKRVDIGGGLTQALATTTVNFGGTWSAGGVILFASSPGSPLFRIPAVGGDAVAVTKLGPGHTGHFFPQFLPGGRQFLFAVAGSADTQGIYLGSLDSPETRRLTYADAAIAAGPTGADAGGMYLPSGWLLYTRQGTLVARRFDPARGELTSDPVIVADAVVGFSVSPAGLVAYRAGRVTNRRQLTWFDRAGKAAGTLGGLDENGLIGPEVSPDGRRAAVTRTVDGNMDIWLLDGARTTRFTFDESVDMWPVWSPDGSRIMFSSARKGVNDLYQKPSNGAGSEELLLESPQQKISNDWSPDGRFILYFVPDPQTSFDLWARPVEEKRKPFVFLNTKFSERKGRFSPDGRWVAYQSNQSGREEVYIRPFPEPGGQWQVSTEGGIWPRWRRDGKELYYIAPDARLTAVPITSKGGTLEPGTPIPLFQTRIVGAGTDPGLQAEYDVAPDGRFLINTALADAASPITLIQNWKPPAN
jgi:eukaryotic-like serine/threonine-protein kinase